MWDRSSITLAKCRNLKFVKDKFQGSPDVIKGLCGSSTNSHPIIFHWVSLKGASLNLVELFDQVGHLNWRSPREFSPRFACNSVLASFLNSPGNTFDLRPSDEGSLAYLACVSPSWLPVPSSSGPRYTHYSTHRVLRQFGFDQDIPPVFKDIVPSLPSLDPFLRLQAFSYWSWRGPNSLCPTPKGESLLPIVLLAIGEEFRSLSLTMLVLARLGEFPILLFSLLLPSIGVYPFLLLVLYLLP